MTIEQWYRMRKARETLEHAMDVFAKQIKGLPPESPLRKALEQFFLGLFRQWDHLAHPPVPPDPGPFFAPMPESFLSPEDLERLREAAEAYNHALHMATELEKTEIEIELAP
jgi:hypothetical protein